MNVILLTHDLTHFVMISDSDRVGCPYFEFIPDGSDLSSLAEQSINRKYGIGIDFIGVLAWALNEQGVEISLVASVKGTFQLTTAEPRLQLISAGDTRLSATDLEGRLFDRARDWAYARIVATDLKNQIDQAMRASIRYLDNHFSVEDGRLGWNQYQDGSTLGMLSTAEGLLSHSHVGMLGEFLEKPATTLEALQNPDGGWQVRFSLVGASSRLSITESTCACLWALHSTGRSLANESVSRGIKWLEDVQRTDGGWSSTVRQDESFVFPTTAAVRVLSKYGRSEALAKAVAWLRKAQRDDGGWGATAPEGTGEPGSSPAYTGYAVVALVMAGLAGADEAVSRGCDYLRATYVSNAAEPWEPTSINTLIDPSTAARLDFRHFATPWALAALCMAGSGLEEPTVVEGLGKLLKLQDSTGGWRCRLNAPQAYPVWATHDALFALRAILSAGVRDLRPVTLQSYLQEERVVLHSLVSKALVGRDRGPAVEIRRRSWINTAWMSLLTLGLAMLALYQFGVLADLANSSGFRKVLAASVSILVATTSAVAPAILTEEYKIRRKTRINGGTAP